VTGDGKTHTPITKPIFNVQGRIWGWGGGNKARNVDLKNNTKRGRQERRSKQDYMVVGATNV